MYEGRLTTDKNLLPGLHAYQKIIEQLVPIQTFARLALSEDQTSDEAQMRSNKLASISGQLASALAFVQSELMTLPEERLTSLQKEEPGFFKYIEEIISNKPYQLEPAVEKALASYSSIFQAPYGLYNTTKLVDMKFPDFTVDGETYPLSYTTFEGD